MSDAVDRWTLTSGRKRLAANAAALTLTLSAFAVGNAFAAELPATGTLDLSTATGSQMAKISAPRKGTEAGTSVASIGDFNGDGKNDFIVGEPKADRDPAASGESSEDSLGHDKAVAFGYDAGAAHVVLGGRGSDFKLGETGNSVTIRGLSYRDLAGSSVSGAGDVNGDGLADVIVGVPNGQEVPEGTNGTVNGIAYVVFGRNGADAIDLNSDNFGGFKIVGEEHADYAGSAVSSIADLNGDGKSEVLVASEKANPGGREDAGSVYVIFGKSSSERVQLGAGVVNSSAGIRIDGPLGSKVGGAYLGRGLASIGDLNGDGKHEILVTAPRADDGKGGYPEGIAYVIWGSSTPQTIDTQFLGEKGFKITGTLSAASANADQSTNGDFLGQSIASVGDVNADGKPDLVVGAHLTDLKGRLNAGRAFVIYGKGDNNSISIDKLDGNGFAIDGIFEQDQTGYAVSSAGDFNADGVDDIAVSSHLADPLTRKDAGAVYVVWGKAGDQDDLDLAEFGPRATRVAGAVESDDLGAAVAPAGDVNGDKGADLLIGAPGTSSEKAGAIYFVYGAASKDEADAPNIDPGVGDPGIPEETAAGCKSINNIEAVIDDSGSMSLTDSEAARRLGVALLLAKQRNVGKLFGAVEFGDVANPVFSPLRIGSAGSVNPDKLLRDRIKADNGGTDYNIAFSYLANENPGARARIFLTDGEHNAGDYAEGHKGGPPTYVVGMGHDITKNASERLARIAKETGGVYYPNVTWSAIQSVMNKIDSKLNCDVDIDTDNEILSKKDDKAEFETKVDGGTHSVDVVVSWGDLDDKVEVKKVEVLQGDKAVQTYGPTQLDKVLSNGVKKSANGTITGKSGRTFRALRINNVTGGKLRVEVEASKLKGKSRVFAQVSDSRRRK